MAAGATGSEEGARPSNQNAPDPNEHEAVAADQEPKKPRTTGEPETRAATNARHKTRPAGREAPRTRHTKEAPQADTTNTDEDEGHQRTEETTTAAREKEEAPERETTMRKTPNKKEGETAPTRTGKKPKGSNSNPGGEAERRPQRHQDSQGKGKG